MLSSTCRVLHRSWLRFHFPSPGQPPTLPTLAYCRNQGQLLKMKLVPECQQLRETSKSTAAHAKTTGTKNESPESKMHNAALYRASNQLQTRDIKEMLAAESKVVFKRAKDGKRAEPFTVLDIGCGPGDATVSLLKPSLPMNAKITAVDVSQAMIHWAQNEYRDVPGVKFIVCNAFDVQTLKEKFDYVTTFFLLHWIKEIPKLIQAFHQAMKPDGELMAVFIAKNPIYEVYKDMGKQGNWPAHMENWQSEIGTYHDSPDPLKEVKRDFEQGGVKIITAKLLDRSVTFPTMEMIRNASEAVSPFVRKMTPEDRRKFMDEFIDVATKYMTRSTTDPSVTIAYQIFCIHAGAGK